MRLTATQELALAHAELLEDLKELEAAARPLSVQGIEEVRAELGRAKAHTTKHFISEEKDGYMANVRKRDPRFDHTIEELRREHRKLAADLDRLIRDAKSAPSMSEPLREGVMEWIAGMRRHESRENQLVQEAFGMDISAED